MNSPRSIASKRGKKVSEILNLKKIIKWIDDEWYE